MKITELRTNHIVNPLGFTLQIPSLSWQIEESKGYGQKEARVEVALDKNFTALVYDTGWQEKLDSLGTPVKCFLEECTRYYWRVTVVTDAMERETSERAWFETGKKKFSGVFITTEKKDISLSYEKRYVCTQLPIRARAYACGLGFYELYVNGKKAGEEYLTPGINGYDSWIQTQTYDILPLLKNGENCFYAMTGDGLYKGRFGFNGGKDKIYGEKQAFLCDIILEYGDGIREIIATGEDWIIRRSKAAFSDIYDGEVWDDTFDDSMEYPVQTADISMEKLVPRLSLPVREMETRRPINIIHSPDGETILDMGQNMVGWLTFICREPKGSKVTLQFGEILQNGNFYNENLRIAKQEFTYISDGSCKEVRPHFTFYGFRYVKLNGFTKEPVLDDFMGSVLYSNMKRTGFVETSNPLVNRLYENVIWGQKGNFVDVPTDCPQRDERMGWTGDAQVFCKTAAFNMDVFAFMMKYCHDMKLEQRKNGGITPMVVPSAGMQGGGCCAWADAATLIPWAVYEYYGDKGILEESYEGMKAWADHICQEDENNGNTRLWSTGFHFGDWLAMDGDNPKFPTGGTEIAFISSCYYLMSTEAVGKAAAVLGKAEAAAFYIKRSQEVRNAVRQEYLTPKGRLALQNQTAYALALYCEIVPEEQRKRLAADFMKRMEKDNGYLKTGFIGTPILCRMLSDYGYNEMAYNLLLNEEMPSWLYCVNMGATTIWERWDSVLPDGNMNPEGMNSLNHYSYGAIAEWMYRNMGGINELEPGFRRVRIAPMPDERIKWVKVSFTSPMGRILSSWHYGEDDIVYELTIPFQVTGVLELAVSQNANILINGETLSEWGREYSWEDNKLILPLRAGQYLIQQIILFS